jgi:molybdopterin/thiamine biosynthesis adenylyltransferase
LCKRKGFINSRRVFALYGQITTIVPGKGPCLRCIIKKMPSEKRNLPVLGTTSGVLGLLEALEVIKLIAGIGKPLIGRALSFDGEDTTFQIINVKKDPECPVCGNG